MAVHFGMLINGQWKESKEKDTSAKYIEVKAPYDGRIIGLIPEAGRQDVEDAIAAAYSAFREIRLSPHERYEILLKTSRLLNEKTEDIAGALAQEAGKPIRDARAEVHRAVQTFLISAEEAKRIHGEGIPVEAAKGSENRIAFTIRVPVGPICAISPFNFPLNLVAHKVAPAIAAGNTVVLKPASVTPITAVNLGKIMMEAGLPPGYLNIIFGPGNTVGEWLLADPRFALYTFTGSPSVGRRLREATGLRRSILELGSNSAVIVHKDSDIDKAVHACVRAGFAYAGQVCISLQRILLHRDIADGFISKFIPAVESLRLGDPLDENTDVGPMITEEAAIKAGEWISEAVSRGAKLLTGGERNGNMLKPAVLKNVDRNMKVVCHEVFAPIVSIQKYATIEEAVNMVNDSDFGLQAGIFTSDINLAFKAAKELQVGGVMINDTSMYRVDAMPYGGVKQSGIGREGPKYSIEEMTDLKIVVFNIT
jgi:acyl-CoA reductase-like NAD-dependent aldehyde dehydrogenase